jgi:hypothetical protein
MNTLRDHDTKLPLKGNICPIYIFSCLIAFLIAVVSVAGLQYRTSTYPTDELIRTFIPNDTVNLFIGLPILLGSMWLAWRGKLIGLLCWAGALFYVLYNYLTYVFALPLNWAFLVHLALTTLSLYTLIGLVASMDGKAVQQRLEGVVPERLAGGVLAALGLLFFLRVIGVVFNALSSGILLPETEIAVNISDFLTTPAWVIGGIMLWRRKELGYVTGLGLLFQGSMLFIALIIFLLLQPFLTSAPFAIGDVVIIFAMGLICFVPFALFVRGVVAKRGISSN